MTAKKKTPDPVLLQIASDVANLEARVAAITQGAVAQQGALEQRMRSIESRANLVAMEPEGGGDVYNIVVNEGGHVTVSPRA